MADGFIVRKGGAVTEQALAPTITEVSTTDSSITFTITNNDASTAVILYELDDATPDANSIELAAGVTSSNLTITGLDDDETYIVYATANVTGKIKSPVASASIDIPEVIVYTAATGGTTTEYDDGGSRYKSHTFTSNGTFEVTAVGNGDRDKVDYLIIAGGGGGASGGGGAGGYLTTLGATSGDVTPNAKVTVTATTYSVTIGSGGNAGNGSSPGTAGVNGTNSLVAFPTTITATGGGAGLRVSTNDSSVNGGSGGGGPASSGETIAGGTGTSGQGFNGGGNGGRNTVPFPTGGGGGASQVGETAPSASVAGAGGNGLANLLRTGLNETRAGGGGGGTFYADPSGTPGSGGSGGGGAGSTNDANATNATANTGSGGGGAGDTRTGGNGAGGIVVVRYEIAPSV